MNNVQQCMSDDGNTHLTQKKHGKPHVKKIGKKLEIGIGIPPLENKLIYYLLFLNIVLKLIKNVLIQ